MTSRFFVSVSALAAINAVAATSALAGGYVAPVVEPVAVVAPPVVVSQPSDWAGAYVGGALGYAFASDDEVGLERRNAAGDRVARSADLGAVDIKGPTFGLHAGYRWQRDNWVFGPELSIEAGSVDASTNVDAIGVAGEVSSELNYLVGLRMKTGYAVDPDTLLYGTFGIAYGDFDYTLSQQGNSQTESYSDTTLTVGLGAERRINERLSAFAEWEFRKFGKTEISYTDGDNHLVTMATPKHHHIKVGVNYRF